MRINLDSASIWEIEEYLEVYYRHRKQDSYIVTTIYGIKFKMMKLVVMGSMLFNDIIGL